MLTRVVQFLIFLTSVASVQLAVGGQDAAQDSLDELAAALESGPRAPGAEPQEGNSGVVAYTADDEMKKALGKAIYENEFWAMERNATIYIWQDFSTKLIFWVVLFLVFVGVVFSGMQFFKGMVTSPGDESGAVSHVEISAQGFKVSSPFLGVVLLVISLGFFYLYLVYVYPISLTK